MIIRVLFTTLLLVLAVAGCKWRQWGDEHYLGISSRNNHRQYQATRSTPIPAAPMADDLASPSGVSPDPSSRAYGSSETTPDEPDSHRLPRDLPLQDAIQIALSEPNIARVSRGDVVTTSGQTFYDVEISEERLRAALATFDTTLVSELYTNQFKNPPDSFFGPGLSQSDARDEAAITAGLAKPLSHGGLLSAAYSPSPGYLFEPGSTSAGFNPRYVSEVELSLRQPLLRNFGQQVTIAPIQIAQLGVEASAWDFKQSLIESVQSIAEAYWDLYAARVAVDEYKEVIPLLKEIVRIQEESLKAKLVIASDVAKSRAQLYQYQQDYLSLQSAVASKELQLKNLMKMPPSSGGELIPITGPTKQFVPTSPNASYLLAIDNRPEVVRQRLDVSLRRLEVLVADNQRKPDLDFTALYRMNGVGENLGNALDQMTDAEFTDVELGFTLAMPVGMRQKKAEAQEARFRLARERQLLEQAMFSVSHEIADANQRLKFAYREYEKSKLWLESASEWVRGARLRYMNPAPDSSDSNWMLQYLDDYYRALRGRTDAAIEVAQTLNRYNAELVRYEAIKGTLLEFFAIDYCGDPCRQTRKLGKPGVMRTPVMMVSAHEPELLFDSDPISSVTDNDHRMGSSPKPASFEQFLHNASTGLTTSPQDQAFVQP
jgi:outer membrane protein TolC